MKHQQQTFDDRNPGEGASATTAPRAPQAPGARPAPDGNGKGAAQRAETPEIAKPGRRLPAWVKPAAIVAGLVALVFLVIYGVRYLRYASTHTSTDDAYVTTDLVQMAPEVPGTLQNLYVDSNQHVTKGQVLFTLDPSAYLADVEQARANLQVAEAAARGAGVQVGVTQQTGSAQVTQARGGVAAAASGVGSATADVARATAGVANARAGVLTASAAVRIAQSALSAAIAARSRAVEAVSAARAQVATAQAAVRTAQADVRAAQANYTKASRDAQRYATLYQENAVSAQQLDAAQAAATAAQSQLQAAQQGVQQAQSAVTARQADLASAQQGVQGANAAISQARAQLAGARDGVQAAEANVGQANAQVAAARQEVQAAQGKQQQAVGQLTAAETAPRQVSVQRANAQTAAAKVAQARAALDNAEINLGHTRITAPVSGIVSADTAEVGEQVTVGESLMTIVPDKDLWVVGNFKETQITDMRAGQPAVIDVDTFPGLHFSGTVSSIAAATGSTFSLLPPDNATGNFTKVVQRVPVKVIFDAKQPGPKEQRALSRLRGGLSALVTVTTGQA